MATMCCLSSRGNSILPGDGLIDLRCLTPSSKKKHPSRFVCSASSSDESSSHNRALAQKLEIANKHIAKVALAAAVAGLLVLTPTNDALAAKSGGRVGGKAFRSAPSPPRAGPRIDNSRRTNVYINPPSFVAPPLFGGPFYGGWGWTPFSFFAPGPSIAIGVGGGFNFFSFLIFTSFVLGVLNFFRRKDDDDYYD